MEDEFHGILGIRSQYILLALIYPCNSCDVDRNKTSTCTRYTLWLIQFVISQLNESNLIPGDMFAVLRSEQPVGYNSSVLSMSNTSNSISDLMLWLDQDHG
ncbi:hypothetical protein PIB30_013193 [Stylosanthes scabra]|uniref:Uncharacterized protein n=1 Tax=Stylosanthes scabra TaxID=79078 RepID=A0ABU6Z390_9FABA|nr:hypothetical protein [Stylosanthes scabra]